MSLFGPARMPMTVVRENCLCGAKLYASSMHSSLVQEQAREFRFHHKVCLINDREKEREAPVRREKMEDE